MHLGVHWCTLVYTEVMAKRKPKTKPKKQAPGRYRTERKMHAQLRFFEVLHIVKDANGEVIFTGSKIMADRILRMLNRDTKAAKVKPKKKPRRRK